MSERCAGKKSWPELIGASCQAAAAKIERENDRVDAIILRERTPVTLDFRCDKVWVWVNRDGKVTLVPGIG